MQQQHPAFACILKKTPDFRRRWVFCSLFNCMFTLALCTTTTCQAQVLEADALQRKQEEQQRARTLTRELLGGVLDVQLRQLEENGLSDQEIYGDIKLMRQNLNQLVETEMSKVVDLLVEAQKLPREQREAVFVEARQEIRKVVRQLAIERQNLLKRLKIAELAEQVRRLIRQQSIVQTATRGLTSEQSGRKEALTLKTVEDQRDVKELFLHLVDTLVDMKSWSGTLAMAAADGLRILKAANVGKHLDGAGQQLKNVQYETAASEQEQVIKGLKELLKVIERAQGALNSEKLAALDRLRAVVEQQKQLREETRQLAETQQPTAEMVERQSQIQQEIARLQENLPESAKAESHVQQAEAAANDAAANLLENKREAAVDDQGRVLGNLAALEVTLRELDRNPSRDKSADELAKAVQQLKEMKTALAAAQQKQSSAATTAEQNAQAAAPEQQAAADLVRQAGEKMELPAAIEAAVAEAATATAEAARTLAAANPEKANAVEEHAIDKASDALDRAVATLDAAIVDAQRMESAVKIGELARAAEVLERAAAEERVIANEAAELAQPDKTSSAEAAKDLAERQAEVEAIAQKAAEALAQTAPVAASNAKDAAAKVQDSSAKLLSAANTRDDESQRSAMQAGTDANSAASKLSEAAREIRNQIVAAATDLAQRSAAQGEKLSEAKQAVEQAADQLPTRDPLAKLQAAREQLGLAMREQAKAAGKPDAAAAMQLAEQISDAIEAQDAASAAAAAAQSGNGSELKATARQEEVAERAQAAAEAARQNPPSSNKSPNNHHPIAEALAKAQQTAADSARQILEGNHAAASESRQSVNAALQQAMAMAQQAANQAASAPPTAPTDAKAQQQAVEAAAQAQTLAAEASAQAASAVTPAADATRGAAEALSQQSDQTATAQSRAESALKQADGKLQEALKNAAAEHAQQMVDESKKSSQLADRIAAVDPPAAAAIDQAAEASRWGADIPDAPLQMAEAGHQAELALEHAAADLGAKEQEVRRDRAIAESIANLTRDQQSAAETIAQQAATLERMAAANDTDSAAQQASAESLNDAQQQFADSQRATGQGAVELSGQREVANPPLREALELASNLPLRELPSAMQEDPVLQGEAVPGGEQPDTQVASDTGEQASDQSTEGPAQGQEGAAHPGGKAGQPKPTALGTGFVPHSPQLTAEMIAGSKAQQAAQRALGQHAAADKSQTKASAPNSAKTNNADEGNLSESDQSTASKLTRKDGAATRNQKVKDGALEKLPEGTDAAGKPSNKSREKEDSILARQLKNESWFAKLPPELRKSIRAGASQEPPRAYEDKLKKYFESVE